MSAMDHTEFGEEEVVENPTLKAAYNLAPLHHNQPLIWDYEVELIGEKIYDKIIHLCETCELPILVYGRMLPCKHVFCFDCARKCEKTCKRCGGRVQKVEKSALGTVYVCTNGAPKHSTTGCRRTYLSQRDLQSHIWHRHMPKSSSSSSTKSSSSSTATSQASVAPQLPLTQQQAAQQAASHPPPPAAVTVVSSSSSSLLGQPSPSLVAGGLLATPNLGSGSMVSSSHSAMSSHHGHGGGGGGMMNPQLAIPGLGDLSHHQQGTAPAVSPTLRQSSPALPHPPQDLNQSSSMAGMGMNYNQPSHHSQQHPSQDQNRYNSPLDMGPMPHQHQPSMMGMPGTNSSMLPGMMSSKQKTMPRLGESSQMPTSSAMMPHLNSPQMSGVSGQLSPSMHMTGQMHHHQQHQQHLLQEQQQQQNLLREQHHQKLIQDQRQHLNPPPHQDSPMLSKMSSGSGGMMSTSFQRQQGQQSNMDSFGSSPGSSSYEPMHAGGPGTGRTNNVNLITVPIQDESHYPPMSSMAGSHPQQSGGGGKSNLPFTPPRSMLPSQNFPQSEGSPGMNRHQPGGFGLRSSSSSSSSSSSYNKGLLPSQSQGMGLGGSGVPRPQQMPQFPQSSDSSSMRMNANNPMMMNPRTGMNNMQANAFVEMISALARPKGGDGGMKPMPSGANAPGGMLSPRFNPQNWTQGNPRNIQPRMSQNQQRPPPRDGGGQFKQYYF